MLFAILLYDPVSGYLSECSLQCAIASKRLHTLRTNPMEYCSISDDREWPSRLFAYCQSFRRHGMTKGRAFFTVLLTEYPVRESNPLEKWAALLFYATCAKLKLIYIYSKLLHQSSVYSSTKFCTTIKTTKYSSWVLQLRPKQIQDGGRLPSWKIEISQYLCNWSTNFDIIWRGDATRPFWPNQLERIPYFINPRWWTAAVRQPPSWKVKRYDI